MFPPGPPAEPDVDKDALYEQARELLQLLLGVEKDPADSAEIAEFIKRLYKIEANNQKMIDDGLAGKMSPQALRKFGG